MTLGQEVTEGNLRVVVEQGEAAEGNEWNPNVRNKGVLARYRAYCSCVDAGMLPEVAALEPEPDEADAPSAPTLTDLEASVLEGDLTPTRAKRVRRKETVEDAVAAYKRATAAGDA